MLNKQIRNLITIVWMFCLVTGTLGLISAEEKENPTTKPEVIPKNKLPYPVSVITGRLINKNTGAPIPDAEIIVSSYLQKLMPLPGGKMDEDKLVFKTDKNGRYMIQFMLATKNRTGIHLFTRSDRYVSGAANKQIYQGETASILPIYLTPYETVQGCVVDQEGLPVVAEILTHKGTVYTDDEGKFIDTHVPPHRFGWSVMAPGGYELKRHVFWIGDVDKKKGSCHSGDTSQADNRQNQGGWQDTQRSPGVRGELSFSFFYTELVCSHSGRWKF